MSKLKVVTGSPYSDNLYTDPKKISAVYGHDGDDFIYQSKVTRHKKFYLHGGKGNDQIFSVASLRAKDIVTGYEIYGGDGNDYITAYISRGQIIDGGEGNDQISIHTTEDKKGNSNIVIEGGAGDDIIHYHGGARTTNINIYGGSGNDTLFIYHTAINDSTRFYGGDGDDYFEFQKIPPARLTELFGDDGIDTIRFNASSNKLISSIRVAPDRILLTFAAYRLNGVGYTQEVFLNSIEKVFLGTTELVV